MGHRMGNARSLILCGWLVVACAAPLPQSPKLLDSSWIPMPRAATIEVSVLFDQQETKIIIAAVSAWNLAAGLAWRIGPERLWCEVFVDPRHLVTPVLLLEPLGTTHCTERGCLIKLRPLQHQWVTGYTEQQAFELAILHELGHAAGLAHLSKGLMASPLQENLSPCIGTIEMNALAPALVSAKPVCLR